MKEPKKCPKCGALQDEINNTEDMSNAFGLNPSDYKKWMCSRCSYLFNDDEAELEAWYDGKDFSKMKLSQIADVIISNWRDDISPRAWPYVEAMMNLDTMDDVYGSAPASSIVTHFLVNAGNWKTETAKKVKKVLRKMLADYEKT